LSGEGKRKICGKTTCGSNFTVRNLHVHTFARRTKATAQKDDFNRNVEELGRQGKERNIPLKIFFGKISFIMRKMLYKGTIRFKRVRLCFPTETFFDV
jgi:hypothetical protein